MADVKGFEDMVVDRLVSQMDVMADAVANDLGMPPDGKRYSPREEAEEWNFSPVADPDRRAQQMMAMFQQGLSVEEITDQIYPNRRRLITAGRPDPEEQIKFARQMARQQARQAREMGYELPTAETMAAPQDTRVSSPPQSGGFVPPVSASPAPAPAGAVQPPAGAPTLPGWAEPGGQFGLTGPEVR